MVCLFVCLCVGHVRKPCKTAEPIEMSFGWVTQLVPSNYVIDGSTDPQGNGQFLGIVWTAEKPSWVTLDCCSWLHSSWLAGVTLTFPREKSAPPLRGSLSSKFFNYLLWLGHITAIAAYCYKQSSVVCLYVCLSVGHVHVCCKNGWTDQDVVWGWLVCTQGTVY